MLLNNDMHYIVEIICCRNMNDQPRRRRAGSQSAKIAARQRPQIRGAASSSTARTSLSWDRPARARRTCRSSLGLKAIEQVYRVLFTNAANMIATLGKALAEGKLEEKLKTYTVPRLLIIDEIGYFPIDQAGATRKAP